MIYVSSRIKFAEKWRALREQYPIRATWIDTPFPETLAAWQQLWTTCLQEAAHCSALVLYAPDEEILKGSLVEVGAALSHGRPVYYAGLSGHRPLGNLLHNPYILQVDTLDSAMDLAKACCI